MAGRRTDDEICCRSCDWRRWSRRWGSDFFNRSDEAIAAADHRLDKPRLFGIIFQRLPDPANGGVDAVVGVDENAFAPDPFDNFLTNDQLATALYQQEQQFHRNAPDPNGPACFSEFVCSR